ncbi:MAG: hypothetical protein IKU40_09155 [Clostridia bacterium]|nr:hypothetical protein [Clostridia bacterium]
MEKLPVNKYVKYFFLTLAIVVSVFVYSFWGSKLESQNKTTKTAEAYGLDSLYAEAEPIMEIRVWQRNEKEYSDYPDEDANGLFFYNVLPLKLKEGETAATSLVTDRPVMDTVIEVVYDGDIKGTYDIVAKNMVTYTGETDTVPANRGGGDGTIRMNDDGSFSGNRKLTMNVQDWGEEIKSSLSHKSSEGTNGALLWLQTLENADNFSFEDYYEIQRFHEAYPETPVLEEAYAELKNYKRVVMTNYLTIHAMHPTKPDTPVATAVLEITTYSSWYGIKLNEAQRSFVLARCNPNYNSGKVTVVSYEQSDFFAMQ